MVKIYLSRPVSGLPAARRTTREAAFVLLALSFVLQSAAGVPAAATCPDNQQLIIRGGTVFEGDDLRPAVKTLLIRDGRMAAASAAEKDPAADACTRVLDAQGLFIVPGLWDLHVHVTKATPGFLDELPRLGITGVRDMGSSLDEIQELRRRIRDDGALLPHLSSPGPMFQAGEDLSGGAASTTLEPRSHTRSPISPDDAELEAQLRSLRAQGADFAKLRSAKDAQEFLRFVDAARRAGLPVATHPPPGLPPSKLPAGLVTIEHASYPYPLVGGDTPVADVVAAFRRAGVVVIPTLTAWKTQVLGVSALGRMLEEGLRNPNIVNLVPARLAVEWRLDLLAKKEWSPEAQEAWNGFYRQLVEDLRALHQGGVPLAAGSDIGVEGVVPGLSLHQELCALETEVGVDPIQLLRSSTVTASLIAGHGKTTGTIAPGKSADLLLLTEDPRTSTRALASLAHVVLRGRPITVREEDRAVLTSACPR